MKNADNRPLISVIVPVYNVENYLRACVDSIIAQTYDNLEIILVDDGSPDNCPAICDEYAEKDRRIKVIHKENGGVSSARNYGIDASKGLYITFIDSDDTVAKNWIEGLYETINDYDLSIAGITYVNDQNQSSSSPIGKEFVDLIKNSLFGYACNKLYKKEAIGDLRFASVQREDIIFNLSLFSSGKTYKLVDSHGYYYFQRNNSLLHEMAIPDIQAIFEFEENIQRSIFDLSETDKSVVYNTVMYSYVTDYIYKLLLSKSISAKEKKRLIKEIISYQPLQMMLKKEYADNTLYRIFYYGIALKSSFIVQYGFELCQNL
jgi:glycosyltransferase involved in cell wall biosynthesis